MTSSKVREKAVEVVFENYSKSSMKDDWCCNITEKYIGKRIKLSGWIRRIRDHGGVKFVDLDDLSGYVQVVIRESELEDNRDVVDNLKHWQCIYVEGEVRKRPEGTENPKIKTGNVEVVARVVRILSDTQPLPFDPDNEASIPSEDVRLKYRYIDLRRERMKQNLIARNVFTRAVRSFLESEGFVEVETPFLTKSTPEGARDFLIPSRMYPGKFYALPQSPQLFKQILQVAQFERYFQIVRCFRDEDLRADRQPEFTQIDIEMSFVDENDVISLVERMLQFSLEKAFGIKIDIPFPRISWREAWEKYGTDKPDIRVPFQINDITQVFRETQLKFIRNAIEKGGGIWAVALKKSVSKTKLKSLESEAKSMGAGGLLWFTVEKGDVTSSPVKKFLTPSEKNAIVELVEGEGTVLSVAGEREKSLSVLSKIAKGLVKDELPEKLSFVWVVDFPLFSWDEQEGRFVSEHHPFTAPHPEDVELIEKDPAKVRARAYDIVLNGEEIGGGSIRIWSPEIQRKVFKVLKISESEAEERFGFLLRALTFAPPPHGGIALGLDRIVSIILGEESIRDVIAFPKTQSGICPLTDAPSSVSPKQLEELKLKIEE